MLYLDEPIGPIGGVMIYRDHADKSLFYYVPERPRLARNDGQPEFVFLKYRRDITDNADFDPDAKEALGGGFLSFTVDLGMEDDQLDAIKEKLAVFADGEVKLTPIQFRKGSVRLSISKDQADIKDAPADTPRGLVLFEEIMGATKPSLYGFNRATFTVVLSQEGATLVEAALRSGISPIGVLYDLEFEGLRPAFNVKVTAEYKRIYDHLETQFGARGQIYAVSLGVDIAAAFQKLRDDGAIKVEVVTFTDDDDLRKQAEECWNWFKTELLKDFFKSALEPPTFMRANSSGGLLGQLTSLLGSLGTSQTVPSQPQRGAPSTQTPTPAPPATSIDSGVQSTAETNRAAAGAGTAGAATGGSGGGSGGPTSVSPFQVAFSLKYYHQEELKTRVFEFSQQSAVARNAAPQGLFSTVVNGLDLRRAIKEVSLDEEFFRRLVATISIGSDLAAAGVSKVAVNLEYPGTRLFGEEPSHIDGFVFSPESMTPHTFNTWLNDRKDLSYRYMMDIHFKPDSPWVGKEAHVTTDWIVTRDRQLTLDPLDVVGLFDVTVSLGTVSTDEVSQIQVEMAYEDVGSDFEAHQNFVLTPGGASTAHWPLRLSDSQQHSYRYQVTYFLKSGVRYRTDWQELENPSCVINDPFAGALEVRLFPLLSADELLEADINLIYQESDTSYERRMAIIFTPDALAARTIKIPTLAQNPEGYTYDLTIIRSDGSVFQSDPIKKTGDDLSPLVISDGIGITKRVKVKLINTNLDSANLVAVKVHVTGPGSTPDISEVLFTSSQINDRTLIVVQPDVDAPFNYHYRITGYSRSGLPIDGQSGDSSDINLMIPLPV